jgi:hypothetical protein
MKAAAGFAECRSACRVANFMIDSAGVWRPARRRHDREGQRFRGADDGPTPVIMPSTFVEPPAIMRKVSMTRRTGRYFVHDRGWKALSECTSAEYR